MSNKSHGLHLIISGLSLLMLMGLGASASTQVYAHHVTSHPVKQKMARRNRTHHARNKNKKKLAHKKTVQHQRLLKRRKQAKKHKAQVERARKLKRRQRLAKKRKDQKKKHQKVTKKRIVKQVVRNHNYGFDDNYKKDVKDIKTAKPFLTYHEIKGNDKISFNKFLYLKKPSDSLQDPKYHHGDPQSITISPDGRLYVLFNISHKNGRINQIFKYDMRKGQNQEPIKGKRFFGGHGQGLAYNYKTHQLLLCMNLFRYKGDHHGILKKDLIISKINQNTLKPEGSKIHVHSHQSLGDNLAYDKSGHYWNVAQSYQHHDKKAPFKSLEIYDGRSGKARMVKDILKSPSAIIQNLSYNPKTNRLYVIGDNDIMSFPASHMDHLNNHDIKVAIMNHQSEFEDLGFWKNRAYLLVHPDRILQSNRSF